jgi:hypothetical protein
VGIAPWVPPTPVTVVIPWVSQAKAKAAPTPVVVYIYRNTGGIVPPAGIALVRIIRIIVVFSFLFRVKAILFYSRIAVYVRKDFTFQYLLVFVGFLPEIVSIYIIILRHSPPLSLWIPLFGSPCGVVRVDAVIIIIGCLLVRATGNQEEAQ